MLYREIIAVCSKSHAKHIGSTYIPRLTLIFFCLLLSLRITTHDSKQTYLCIERNLNPEDKQILLVFRFTPANLQSTTLEFFSLYQYLRNPRYYLRRKGADSTL